MISFTKIVFHVVLILMMLSSSACTSLTSLLFYPDQHYYQQPEDLGLPARRVDIQTKDGEHLANWYLESKQTPVASVLFLHGNAENISTHINSVAWLTQSGYRVFLLDYRGYGQSTGSSTLATALTDVEAAHRWLSTNDDLPLVIFGQSLGGALALTYTAKVKLELKPIRAVATESAPASWPQIAREVMRQNWLTWLLQIPASLIPGKFDAEDHIGEIKDIPLLIMHSPDDAVVPYHHGRQLMAAAPESAQWLETKGGHIAGFANLETRRQFLSFLAQALDLND